MARNARQNCSERSTMRLFAFLFLFATAAWSAGEYPILLTASMTGVSGENLSDTPVTDAIDMLASSASNQLALTLAVTPGTSSTITLYCSESETNIVSTMAVINKCPGGVCAPDVRTFTLSNYTAVDGVKYITARFDVKKRYAACTADDAANGSGTVTITGTRSWQ